MARVVNLQSRTDPTIGIDGIPVDPLLFALAGVPMDTCDECEEFKKLEALAPGEEIDVNEEVHAVGVA